MNSRPENKVRGVLHFTVIVEKGEILSMNSDDMKINRYAELREIDGMENILSKNIHDVKNLFKTNSNDRVVIIKDDTEPNLFTILYIWFSNEKLENLVNVCIEVIKKNCKGIKIRVPETSKIFAYQAYENKNKIETMNSLNFLKIKVNEKVFVGRNKLAWFSFFIGLSSLILLLLEVGVLKYSLLSEFYITLVTITMTYSISNLIEYLYFLTNKKRKTYIVSISSLDTLPGPEYESNATFERVEEE